MTPIAHLAATHPLELRGATLRLGAGDTAVTALDQVELAVEAGEVLAVVGPSGSGKSSLLAVAGALAQPDAGSVRVAGLEVTRLSARRRTEVRRRHVGYVFQNVNLLASLTVREQLLLAARIEGRIGSRQRARAGELIEAVGLAHRADRRPHQLSGGERQRAGLARALMARPKVLLLDEPTSALDRVRAGEIAALISEQAHRLGTATVLVTHDQGILGSADRVREMRDGRMT